MERQVLDATRRGSIEGVILRYGLFYGLETPSTVTMIEMVRKRRLPIVRGDAGQLPLIHVADAVSATLLALDRAPAGGVYDIVDDRAVSLTELVEGIALHPVMSEGIHVAGLDPHGQREPVPDRDVLRRRAAEFHEAGATFQYPSGHGRVPDKIAACFGIEGIDPSIPLQRKGYPAGGVALGFHARRERELGALDRQDAIELVSEAGMQSEAAARQRIQRAARAPIERQETARFAGGCTRHVRALDNDDFYPASNQKVGGARRDDTATTNHNPHRFSTMCRRVRISCVQ
jgi:hypothetical protein